MRRRWKDGDDAIPAWKDWVHKQEDQYEGCSPRPDVIRLPIIRGWFGSNKFLLDCGVLNGCMTNPLSEDNAVVGFDLPRVVRSHLSDYNFPVVVADAEFLPFKTDTFDGVFGGELIEHLFLPKKFVSDVHHVLKGGGLFVISTPNGKVSLSWGDHCSGFEDEELKDLLVATGFEVLEVIHHVSRGYLVLARKRRIENEDFVLGV